MKLNEVQLEYRKNLNPKLWKDLELKDDVTVALKKITDEFVKYLDVDIAHIEDVIITGSNCNYNWGTKSDLDLHVKVNYEKFQETCKTVDTEEMFLAKKSLWNLEHKIKVHDIPVELYVEDIGKPKSVDYVEYSLLFNRWNKPPVKRANPNVDKKSIKDEAKDIANQLDTALKSKPVLSQLQAIRARLVSMRQRGLDRDGEMSKENLIYKTLRDDGAIEKLYYKTKKVQDDDLSL